MQIGVRVNGLSADLSNCVKQVEESFGPAFAEVAAKLADFERVQRIEIGLGVSNPIWGDTSSRPSGSFDKESGIFYCRASIDYGRFVRPQWSERISAYADAATRAAGAIHKTRISEAERASLVAAIADATTTICHNPPASLVAAGPVLVSYRDDGSVARVSYQTSGEATNGVGERLVLPEHVSVVAAEIAAASTKVEPVELYSRTGGIMLYHRAWPTANGVIEHFGRVGETGERREHMAASDPERRETLASIAMAAQASGFRKLAPSRLTGIEIVAPLGDGTNIGRRHNLEDLLEAGLSDRGLGYCDGGSSGSGTMEVFCIVVDRAIAKRVIATILADGGYNEFVIKRSSAK